MSIDSSEKTRAKLKCRQIRHGGEALVFQTLQGLAENNQEAVNPRHFAPLKRLGLITENGQLTAAALEAYRELMDEVSEQS